MTHLLPRTARWIFTTALLACLSLFSQEAKAQTATLTFDLKNIYIASQEMTGTFTWTYKPSEFENGTGTFTNLYIPIWGTRTTPSYKVDIQPTSLEITMIGNYHNLGLDVTVKFLSKLSPNQPTQVDPNRSKYDINGRKGVITGGSIAPRLTAPTKYGVGSAGTAGIVPTQSSSGGLPTLGNSSFQLNTSLLLGGANCFLLLGPQATNQTVFGVGLLVDPSTSILVGLQATGPMGGAGSGNLNYPLPVPNNLQLIGAKLNVQTVALDTGSPQGVASASNGLHLEVLH